MTTHFARILDTASVRTCVGMLEDLTGANYGFDPSEEFFEVKAPDGDVVFSAMLTRGKTWICRLHREVFTQ